MASHRTNISAAQQRPHNKTYSFRILTKLNFNVLFIYFILFTRYWRISCKLFQTTENRELVPNEVYNVDILNLDSYSFSLAEV